MKLTFLLFFSLFTTLTGGTITHHDGKFYLSIEHFILGFGIDIYNSEKEDECREIGPINALNYSKEGFSSKD